MKTNPPDSRPNKRYWTKANLIAYLRSCSYSGKFIEAVYQSARKKEKHPPFPATWADCDAFSKCHYAPMHMVYLGHVKSDIEMLLKWLNRNEVLATFGKQANIYLSAVRNLRVNKYFTAHPFSTSSWGTGVWVSENYLFWGRVMKFFLLLPALHKERLEVKNINYKKEFRMIQRFVSTTQACLCRLMSTRRIVPDLEETILLYMDTMVELDRWILCLPQDDSMLGSNDQESDDVEPMNVDISDNLPDLPAKRVASVCNITRLKTKKKSSRMKLPNFVKSNSLEMLAAAQSHIFHGPAMLHWEGGWHGERKIQQVKPLLHIKRSNADWPTIALLFFLINE